MENINVYAILVTWKKPNKNGKYTIAAAVDLNNSRVTIVSLKRKATLDEWDKDLKKVKDEVPNSQLLNAAIRRYIDDLSAVFLRKQLLNIPLNKESIKKLVKNVNSDGDFYAFSREQIMNKPLSKETKRQYTGEISKLEKFRSTLNFTDIDFQFLQSYGHYMRTVLKNSENTVWKTFKCISTMINDAMKIGGYIEVNPFKTFNRGRYKQGIPDYLEWPQILQLHKTIKEHVSLTAEQRLIGYYSLLSYYSGFRFSDAIKFTYEKYVMHTEHGERLLLTTEKTGEIVSIAFTDQIREVVDYIKDRPMRPITNQVFNENLKIIGGLAQIKTPLHTHMARHSFAMRCADLGMTEDAVKKLLGHKDRQATKIYFKIKDRRLDNEMNVWNNKEEKELALS